MPRLTPPPLQSQTTLDRLDERMSNLIQQVVEFRREYKEQTTEIKQRQDEQFGQMSQKQDEQFATIMRRVMDIETWKATEIQPTRIMKWDEAASKVDSYLSDKHVARREKVFRAVESHLDTDDKLEGLAWLARNRDRWGFILTIIGTLLGVVSGLFYWLLNHFIAPLLTGGK